MYKNAFKAKYSLGMDRKQQKPGIFTQLRMGTINEVMLRNKLNICFFNHQTCNA